MDPNAGTAADGGLSHQLQLIQAGVGLDDKVVQRPVSAQEIGTPSQEEGGDVQSAGSLNAGNGLLRGLGQRHHRHRAADAEGGIVPHGFLLFYQKPRADPVQFCFQLIE